MSGAASPPCMPGPHHPAILLPPSTKLTCAGLTLAGVPNVARSTSGPREQGSVKEGKQKLKPDPPTLQSQWAAPHPDHPDIGRGCIWHRHWLCQHTEGRPGPFGLPTFRTAARGSLGRRSRRLAARLHPRSRSWFLCRGEIRENAKVPHVARTGLPRVAGGTYRLAEDGPWQGHGWQSLGVPCRASPKNPGWQRSQCRPSVWCWQPWKQREATAQPRRPGWGASQPASWHREFSSGEGCRSGQGRAARGPPCAAKGSPLLPLPASSLPTWQSPVSTSHSVACLLQLQGSQVPR